jgi:hypothetical protein
MANPNPHRISPNDIGPDYFFRNIGKKVGRRITELEVELSARYVCMEWGQQWVLRGPNRVARCSIQGRYNDAMVKGCGCWLFIRYKAQHEVFLFPKEFVQGVCRYLEVPDEKLIFNDHSGPISLDAFPEYKTVVPPKWEKMIGIAADNVPDDSFREIDRQGSPAVFIDGVSSERV